MIIQTSYGRCGYSFESDDLGDYVHIHNLFVLPEHRRKGKARELIELTKAKIRESYSGPIQIVASPLGNSIPKKKLTSFYESLGLEVFERYG